MHRLWPLWGALMVADAAAAVPRVAQSVAWEYLVDSGGRLTVDAVAVPPHAAAWRPLTAQVAHFGLDRSAHWFRFRVPATLPASPVVVIDYPHLDEIDVYRLVDGVPVAHHAAGDVLPFAARPLPTRIFAFPLDGAAAGEQVLVRVRTAGMLRVLPQVRDGAAVRSLERRNVALWLAAGGALGMLAVLHLAAFANGRRWHHLGVIVTITTSALFCVCLEGLGYQYLWPDSPLLQNEGPPVAGALAAAVFSLFGIELLRQALWSRPLARAVYLWSALCAVLVGVTLVAPYWLGVRLIVFFGLCAIVVATAAGFALLLRGDRPLRPVAVAWLAVCGVALHLAMTGVGISVDEDLLVGLQPLPLVAAFGALSLTLLRWESYEQRIRLARLGALVRRLRTVRAAPAGSDAARLKRRLKQREAELAAVRADLARLRRDNDEAVLGREAFDRRYRIEWRRAFRERNLLTLMLFEVDGAGGEDVTAEQRERSTQRLVSVLVTTFRRPADLVARFGPGLVAVLAVATPEEDALRLADGVRNRFAEVDPERGDRFTVSAGIASLLPGGRQHDAVLLSYADDALYQARSAGGNRVVCYRLPMPAVQ